MILSPRRRRPDDGDAAETGGVMMVPLPAISSFYGYGNIDVRRGYYETD